MNPSQRFPSIPQAQHLLKSSSKEREMCIQFSIDGNCHVWRSPFFICQHLVDVLHFVTHDHPAVYSFH
jgi:hypothetical protein